MRDWCSRIWSQIREWWWFVPLVIVWGMVAILAAVQNWMLAATLRCLGWLADCLDEEVRGD